MKKFFISFILIVSLLFNVFADNKQAHKELREAFENYSMLPEMIEKGFDLDKLDKIDDWKEMGDYLQPFFQDENGYPLDNHTNICFNSLDNTTYRVLDTESSMFIDWTDEYGSKDELLKKGFKEDEIFYYPYFNGEWRDGYRVGKKFMGNGNYRYRVSNHPYLSSSKKALLVGISDFFNNQYYSDISNSKKKYLILDLSYNYGGSVDYYFELVDAIKKMKPKEIFILCDNCTSSMGEFSSSWIEKATNIKTTIIGYPTWGGWKHGKIKHTISFDTFIMYCDVEDNKSPWRALWDRYGIPYPVEGIGVTPDIYTNNVKESLEVVKHLIKDDSLYLPEDYIQKIDYGIKYKKWK